MNEKTNVRDALVGFLKVMPISSMFSPVMILRYICVWLLMRKLVSLVSL